MNANRHLAPLLLVAAVLLLSCIVRIRLDNVPLERDEGEHGYAAQMMLAGNAPWKLAYNMKLPGTDAFYALWLALFGQTAVAIRAGLLLINAATIILITALGKRLFGLAGGAATGASYGILSLSPGVLGTIAHSTHYVAFFAVLGTLLVLRESRWAAFAGGVAYGLAFLMKQPGIFFAVFGAFYLIWEGRRGRPVLTRLAVFVAGVITPIGVISLCLWRAGVFPRFWFWTVTLAGAYAGEFTLFDRFDYLRDTIPRVVVPDSPLWLLAAVGLVLACAHRSTRRFALVGAVFVVCSFSAVASAGVFEPHYFIVMLPAVALAAGACAAPGKRKLLPVACVAAACFYSVATERKYLFRMTPYEFARDTWGTNPFPEAVKIADYIRSHSAQNARVAVLGSEAEIYFYARRRSATGYLFTYGLMDANKYALPMQEEMISEISAARPEYIVWVNVVASWLVARESSKHVFQWAAAYTGANYTKVGIAEIPDEGETRYVWAPQAAQFQPSRPNNLIVFRRTDLLSQEADESRNGPANLY